MIIALSRPVVHTVPPIAVETAGNAAPADVSAAEAALDVLGNVGAVETVVVEASCITRATDAADAHRLVLELRIVLVLVVRGMGACRA